MWYAQIAVITTPAREWHAWTTIGRTHRVLSVEIWSFAAIDRRQLFGTRCRHRPADTGTENVQRQANAQRGGHAAVGYRSLPVQPQQHHRHDPDRGNSEPHRAVNGGVERGVDVEMTGGAARCLYINDDNLVNENPADQLRGDAQHPGRRNVARHERQ